MTTSKEKILELIAAGKLTPAEAEVLLSALDAPRVSFWEWAFQPIAHLPGGTALALSLLPVLAGVAVAPFGIRFDGTLDVHSGRTPVSLTEVGVDAVVAWPLSATVLWLASVCVARRGRWVDFLAVTGLARLPLVLIAFIAAVLGEHLPDPAAPGQHLLTLPMAVLALASLPLIGWSITLLVMGYRTASGLRGPPMVVSFLIGLLLAEVLSKILVGWS